MSDELISIAEYAEIKGITRQAVYKQLSTKLSKFVVMVDNKKYLQRAVLSVNCQPKAENAEVVDNGRKVYTGSKSELIDFLTEQVRQKDEQIAKLLEVIHSKDEQVERLLLVNAQQSALLTEHTERADCATAADEETAIDKTKVEGQTRNGIIQAIKRRMSKNV